MNERTEALLTRANETGIPAWALGLAWTLNSRRDELFCNRSGTSLDESLVDEVAKIIKEYVKRLPYDLRSGKLVLRRSATDIAELFILYRDGVQIAKTSLCKEVLESSSNPEEIVRATIKQLVTKIGIEVELVPRQIYNEPGECQE